MELKRHNKKGVIFTTLVVVIISLFLLSSLLYSNIKDRKAIRNRVETLNSFIFSLQKDISRQLYISSYRALVAIESHITANGIFIQDSENLIKEALLNGTINSTSIGLMEGYKLKDWESRITELGDKTNIQINYSLLQVETSQEDPWNVDVKITINISLKDKNNLAEWHNTMEIKTKIEIKDFEDPLYLLNTNGLLAKKIIKTPYATFVQGADVTNLSLHLNNTYYKASSSAPSFLDRLEGKTSPNPNGIESLVNLNELQLQGIPTQDKSVIDYIYFSSSNPSSYLIQNMPSWFKIDEAHLDFYQVRDLKLS